MQRLLWKMESSDEDRTPDDYAIHARNKVSPYNLRANVQVVLGYCHDNNAKRLWVVYTRIQWDGPTWFYRDGLEFRVMRNHAIAEYHARIARFSDYAWPNK